MKKRNAFFLLTLCMMFAMGACTGKDTAPMQTFAPGEILPSDFAEKAPLPSTETTTEETTEPQVEYTVPETEEVVADPPAENAELTSYAQTLPLGQWTSIWINRRVGIGFQSYQEMTTDFSVEIFDDGTYVAQLEKAVAGEWIFEYYDEISGSYLYSCKKDENGRNTISFWFTPGEELIFYHLDSGRNIGYGFSCMEDATRLSLEEEVKTAYTLPVGTWISCEIYQTPEAGDVSSEAKTDCRITLNADGTFTGLMPEFGNKVVEVSSTWCLAAIDHSGDEPVYRYDLLEEDSSWDKHLYLRGNDLYLHFPGDGSWVTIRYKR